MSNNLFHIAIAGILFSVLIAMNFFGWLSPILDAGRLAARFSNYPLVKIFTKTRELGGIVWNLKDLAVQNTILSQQVAQLSAELAEAQKAGAENQTLREALGLTRRSRYALIAADVISRDGAVPEAALTINRGANHGVSVGDAVVAPEGVLVGMIIETTSNTSKLELITSSRISVNAVTSTGRITGVVKGEHGLGLLLDLIPQGESIAIGESVLTSDQSDLFPSRLLIGKIGEVRAAPSELFQRASLVPAVNLRNLGIVLVVKK